MIGYLTDNLENYWTDLASIPHPDENVGYAFHVSLVPSSSDKTVS